MTDYIFVSSPVAMAIYHRFSSFGELQEVCTSPLMPSERKRLSQKISLTRNKWIAQVIKSTWKLSMSKVSAEISTYVQYFVIT